MRLLLSLFETMAVFFVLFHVYSRSPAFRPMHTDWIHPRARVSLFVFFTGIAILGTYLGRTLSGGAIANTRAVGAVLAGMLGGPLLGGLVGFSAGLHRLTFGGFTALAGALATTLEGVLGGLVHRAMMRRRAPERLIDWKLAALFTAAAEVLHMGLVLALSRPFAEAWQTVQVIGPPMVLANAAGTALFMTVLRDRQNLYDQAGAASSVRALRIAQRTLGLLGKGFTSKGFTPAAASEMATIIREETGVGAVAITDAERVLAFEGTGSDHHRSGTSIASPLTRRALAQREVVFADGVREHFVCPLSPRCPLDSVVVVPLELDGVAIATVQLFEPRRKRFRSMNRSLGQGLAELLSNQLLRSRYEEQKNLLVLSELKLIQAQVNPHFLFNTLNTIIAVTRLDPVRARALLVHLSHFFRKNLKRTTELSTLAEELEHVGAYLEIEKARFQDRLVVETDVDPSLLSLKLPTFTLQPLIENAVKHGVSATLTQGLVRIRAQRRDGLAVIDIEDNAGTYEPPPPGGDGLGLTIVDKRIKSLVGAEYGVTVSSVPDELTRVTVWLPLGGRPA